MNIPSDYSDELPFREQVLYALSLIRRGTVAEVMVELIELKGLSTEESVADLTIETSEELEKMSREKVIETSTDDNNNQTYFIWE
jgi:hypothetical protein